MADLTRRVILMITDRELEEMLETQAPALPKDASILHVVWDEKTRTLGVVLQSSDFKTVPERAQAIGAHLADYAKKRKRLW